MDHEQAALSKAEFAREIGVSRDSVDRAIRRGEIKAIRFGRLVRISRQELDRILAGGETHKATNGNGDAR